MRDVNFFSIYKGKLEKKKNSLKYFYFILLVLAVFTVSDGAATGIKIYLANKEINEFNEKLEAPEIQTKLNEANNVNSEIDILKQYDSKINEISNSVKNRESVKQDLFVMLNSKLPSDVNFKSITVNSNEISIEGTSKDNDAVAEYQHNLKEINEVSSVFIESLDKSNSVDDEYSFKLNCVLKDVE